MLISATRYDNNSLEIQLTGNYFLFAMQNGRTPLMVASIEGYVDIVKMLVEARTNSINKQNEVFEIGS